MNKKKFQVNMTIPTEWREILRSQARQYAAQQDIDCTYIDMIKLAMKEYFNLPDIQIED